MLGEGKRRQCLAPLKRHLDGSVGAMLYGEGWNGRERGRGCSRAFPRSQRVRGVEEGRGEKGENALASAGTRWRRRTMAMRQPAGEMTRLGSKRHDDIGSLAASSRSARRDGMRAAVSDTDDRRAQRLLAQWSRCTGHGGGGVWCWLSADNDGGLVR